MHSECPFKNMVAIDSDFSLVIEENFQMHQLYGSVGAVPILESVLVIFFAH